VATCGAIFYQLRHQLRAAVAANDMVARSHQTAAQFAVRSSAGALAALRSPASAARRFGNRSQLGR
jgi:hypothetical protein